MYTWYYVLDDMQNIDYHGGPSYQKHLINFSK